jgi:hypothetical protein
MDPTRSQTDQAPKPSRLRAWTSRVPLTTMTSNRFDPSAAQATGREYHRKPGALDGVSTI